MPDHKAPAGTPTIVPPSQQLAQYPVPKPGEPDWSQVPETEEESYGTEPPTPYSGPIPYSG